MQTRILLRIAVALLLAWGTDNGHAAERPAPRRIVSICLQGDQILLHLVPRERIVALSQFAADPDLSAHWEKALGYPLTRGSAEELARLKPDLVLASSFTTRLPVALLKQHGVRVLELGIPNDFDELRAQIRLAGEALGEEAGAEQWVREMDDRLDRLKAHRPAPDARPTALFYFQDGFVPGAHTFANALLEVAGFSNLGAGLNPGLGACTSLEAILLARPRLLILTRYREANPTQTQLSTTQPLFAKLGAQTEVVRVPFRQLASPDPSNLDLAEQLQSHLLQ